MKLDGTLQMGTTEFDGIPALVFVVERTDVVKGEYFVVGTQDFERLQIYPGRKGFTDQSKAIKTFEDLKCKSLQDLNDFTLFGYPAESSPREVSLRRTAKHSRPIKAKDINGARRTPEAEAFLLFMEDETRMTIGQLIELAQQQEPVHIEAAL